MNELLAQGSPASPLGAWALCLSPLALGLCGLPVGAVIGVHAARKPVAMMRGWLSDCAQALQDGDAWRTAGLTQPPTCERLGRRTAQALEDLSAIQPAASRVRVVGLAIMTGALFACAAWRFGPHPATLAWCAAIASMLAMAVIDNDTGYLPDDLTMPLLWGGLLVSALGWTLPLHAAWWGAVAGYCPLWLVARAFARVTGHEGLGAGDLKLLAALGAWLGWTAVLPIVLVASIAGICVNMPRSLLAARGRWQPYPFGPFLVGGGLLLALWGVAPMLQALGLHGLA
jgi:leader peptidase (prepilin peptidase)/N-methyltransferase